VPIGRALGIGWRRIAIYWAAARTSAPHTSNARRHRSLRRRDLSQQLPLVPRRADGGKAPAPAARWLGRGLDGVPGLLSVCATLGLSGRPWADHACQRARARHRLHRAACGVDCPAVSSHQPRSSRESVASDRERPLAPHGPHWTSVRELVGHEPVAPGMVLALGRPSPRGNGRERARYVAAAVSAIRDLECRLDVGARGLSLAHRTAIEPSRAGRRRGRRVHVARRVMRRDRVFDP
jgi:hypothetical protein